MSADAKPWGTESLRSNNERFAVYELELAAGACTPWRRSEGERALLVRRGCVAMDTGEEESPACELLEEGSTRALAAGTAYRLRSEAGCALWEVGAAREETAPEAPVTVEGPAVDLEIVIEEDAVPEESLTRRSSKMPPPPPAVSRPFAPTVLVVEDDLSIQDLLVRALGSRYTVYRADHGLEALTVLRRVRSVDVVVTDLSMPHMDGLELLRALGELPRGRRPPVVVLTARTRARDFAEVLNAGAAFYLAKPFKLAELFDRVKRALEASPKEP